MAAADDALKAFETQDHSGCAGDALTHAERAVAERGLRLTPVRRKALEILLEEHRALGAYDVLERLAGAGFARQPPVAYRALDFLVEHGFAHRIQSLNAYTACMHPGAAHSPAFFICDGCKLVAEAPQADMRQAVESAADRMGFAIDRMNVEAVGRCPACRAAG